MSRITTLPHTICRNKIIVKEREGVGVTLSFYNLWIMCGQFCGSTNYVSLDPVSQQYYNGGWSIKQLLCFKSETVFLRKDIIFLKMIKVHFKSEDQQTRIESQCF